MKSNTKEQNQENTRAGSTLGQVARGITDEIGLTSPEKSASRSLSAQQIYALIQETAYFKAEARGFSPGLEEQDWLEAEAEIKARLGIGDRTGG